MGMKEIIKLFSEHGTFVQPEVIDYISSKQNPHEFASLLIKEMKDFPLVLTLSDVKAVEEILTLDTKEVETEDTENASSMETAEPQDIYEENDEDLEEEETEEKTSIDEIVV